MPTLNWIGKDAVVKHHKDVPFRLLEPVPELSHGTPEEQAGNLIVQGDNLHALKALLPRYAGKVKCIYIDPPYNTGNEGWVYNDNVNSPEIRRWLHDTVGKEGEDLSRHDKWLCMMYPRLVLLRQFLTEDGAIFISIDDNEVSSLRQLMDEIFGRPNFVTTIAWQKIYTVKNSAKHFSEMHDYVVVYAKAKKHWNRQLFQRSKETEEDYTNPDNDQRGVWTTNALQSRNRYSKGKYQIKCPSGRIIAGPPKGTYWRTDEKSFWELDADKRVWWGNSGNNDPRIKKFLSEAKDGVVPSTWWEHRFAGTNSGAKTELRSIFSDAENDLLFNTPKPWQLISRILEMATDKNSIVFDSFAGSGATAHAVLNLNKLDGGNRTFVLVEIDFTVAKHITRERVKRVIDGYKFEGKKIDELVRFPLSFASLAKVPDVLADIEELKEKEEGEGSKIQHEIRDNHLIVTKATAVTERMPALGGSFQYCSLSPEPLFDASGAIREDVGFAQLAEFVWFAETGTGYTGASDSPLLGMFAGSAVYLLYNGILKDRSAQGGNVLTAGVLAALPEYAGPKTIYAAACRLGGPRLNREQITFKQTPYALEV